MPEAEKLRVTALARYPIKGCRGHSCEAVSIDRLGVVGDRRLMLVDARGSFLSQREVPALATLIPHLDGEFVTVSRVGASPLVHAIDAGGPLRPVELWGDEIWAIDQGDAAAEWFGEAIQQTCRLVWFGPGSERFLDQTYSPRPDAETAFTDGYPLLAVLEESLADLNGRLASPVPMNRFRPNIVVAGAAAWSEDLWRTMQVGEVRFDAVKPCSRCQVTTTDQESGERSADQEPLRTLASFRTIPGLGAMFGQNLVPGNDGIVRLGDTCRLVPGLGV